MLAQEARLPSLRTFLDHGREGHREWITQIFAAWLTGLPAALRRRRIDQLYAATDVNTWKLLRRDFGHSTETTAETIADLTRRIATPGLCLCKPAGTTSDVVLMLLVRVGRRGQ